MMIGAPLLVSILPGLILIFITWWFKKLNLPLLARVTPSVLAIIAAVVLFYIGYVEVRGFEGAAYGFLSFFLVIFAGIGFVVAQIPNNKQAKS